METIKIMKAWITQLRKGLLEFCILRVLARRETYGYELIGQLKGVEELAITESTAYPILNRLRKDGLVKVRLAASPAGPARRYFSLTALGISRIREMNNYWKQLCFSIDSLQSQDREDPKP